MAKYNWKNKKKRTFLEGKKYTLPTFSMGASIIDGVWNEIINAGLTPGSMLVHPEAYRNLMELDNGEVQLEEA